jgi:thiamine biosynthesis lipoprotein
VERYDRTWSRFREDSLVTRVARTAGSHEFPEDAPALFALYRELYEATDGALSPLVGRALEQWGYDRAYSLRPNAVVAPVPRWEDAISWDGHRLTTLAPVVVDVGAAGKGQLVDLLSDILTEAGVADHSVDGSGDLRHHGTTPLRVALEHPLDTSRAIGVATLSDGALCASASNRRAWPGAHHILDALTGTPVREVVASWAIAPTALVADGLATALFVGEPARLAERFEFEWVRMFADGRVEASTGFDGEMFR